MLTITSSQLDNMAQAMEGTRMTVPCGDKVTWISIELLNDEGNPVSNERYLIRLPDASRMGGRLDAAGKARVDGIVPGTCQVSFPDIDAREWYPT